MRFFRTYYEMWLQKLISVLDILPLPTFLKICLMMNIIYHLANRIVAFLSVLYYILQVSKLLVKVMSLDLKALLLDPGLLKVIFYDLILCTVLLLWYVNIMSCTPVTNEKL